VCPTVPETVPAAPTAGAATVNSVHPSATDDTIADGVSTCVGDAANTTFRSLALLTKGKP